MGEALPETVFLSFHGVRGSTPCSSPALYRYGGNTSCVSLHSTGHVPVVFDLGTGLRLWGCDLVGESDLEIHALVSHMHWDHIQGVPFFLPLHRPDTTMHIYGPGHIDETMGAAFDRFMAPPFFPIHFGDLPSTIDFRDDDGTEFMIDEAVVRSAVVPHTGLTYGYRVTLGGVSVAYVPDHQEPVGDPSHVDPAVLDLCADVDVLIHDAQFVATEFGSRPDWGHCTIDYAVEVAAQSRARTLVLFHHDPAHDDDMLDRMRSDVIHRAHSRGIETVVTAAEGMKLVVGPGI